MTEFEFKQARTKGQPIEIMDDFGLWHLYTSELYKRGEVYRVKPQDRFKKAKTNQSFEVMLNDELDSLKELLLAKNRAYGNSALNPSRVFSRANEIEQIKVRIDDKLSRLKNQDPNDNEDTILDLLGYLVLLRIATKKGEQ